MIPYGPLGPRRRRAVTISGNFPPEIYQIKRVPRKTDDFAGEEKAMNHKGTISLETGRLLLRRFVPEDAGAMYQNWASREEVTRFLTWPVHRDVTVTQTVLSGWIDGYQSPDFYNWAIELKELGQVIGNISVVRIKENVRSAELGYCMGSAWWGLGIMPEAGKAVIRYLFEDVGFQRIAAAHARDNPKSGRVMQKIGMTYEGTLRKAGACNQGVIDVVWYSILREEYPGGAG